MMEGTRQRLHAYYFFNFLAISCISLGLSSARTLSTMLASASLSTEVVSAASSELLVGPSAGADVALTGSTALAASATDSAIALALCGVITESRICCQFCHAAAASEREAPVSSSVA